MSYELLLGDCVEVMRTLPAGSCQMVCTSPPYFGLRSYLESDHADKRLEIGTEETPEAYVAKLVEVFREVRRVLRDDGTCWINLGDTYANFNHAPGGAGMQSREAMAGIKPHSGTIPMGCKPKDLIGIPWMVAFALRADGWWLRSAITWCKGNPMPESVTDRCTSATEMVFMLAKSQTYFYDSEAISEPASQPAGIPKRTGQHKANELGTYRGMYADTPTSGLGTNQGAATRNKRNWWVINSEPYPESHFATMPTKLVEPCILAGSSARGACSECGAPWERVVEREPDNSGYKNGPGGRNKVDASRNDAKDCGTSTLATVARYSTTTVDWQPTCTCNAAVVPCTVLDCFNGAATVGVVALKHHRNYIGIDLNSDYLELSEKRLNQSQPMLEGLFA